MCLPKRTLFYILNSDCQVQATPSPSYWVPAHYEISTLSSYWAQLAPQEHCSHLHCLRHSVHGVRAHASMGSVSDWPLLHCCGLPPPCVWLALEYWYSHLHNLKSKCCVSGVQTRWVSAWLSLSALARFLILLCNDSIYLAGLDESSLKQPALQRIFPGETQGIVSSRNLALAEREGMLTQKSGSCRAAGFSFPLCTVYSCIYRHPGPSSWLALEYRCSWTPLSGIRPPTLA